MLTKKSLSLGLGLLLFIIMPAFGASRVLVKGNQLLVSKPDEQGLFTEFKPYIIKGVTWSPETQAPDYGPNPLNRSENIEYGFFFDWKERKPQGHEIFVIWKQAQFINHYATDIPLMKKMNTNTVRVYSSFGQESEQYTKILDEFFRNQIMVIMTVVMSKKDIEQGKHQTIVRTYKNHPAILFWSIGNEWNLEYNKFWGYETVSEAAKAVNEVAKEIKAIDCNHPVASSLGDRFFDEKFENSIEHILYLCPEVDIWGFNIYRGKSFGSLFSQWQGLTEKPFFICEFGTDSFSTFDYGIVNGYQADNCQGRQDQAMQAEFALGLWREIERNLSTNDPTRQCLGGIVHEFNDSLWKVGSYHVGLGGLIDYNSQERCSYYIYNTEGFYLPGAHPDDVANEEYFGIVDAARKPKKIYFELQKYYGKI